MRAYFLTAAICGAIMAACSSPTEIPGRPPPTGDDMSSTTGDTSSAGDTSSSTAGNAGSNTGGATGSADDGGQEGSVLGGDASSKSSGGSTSDSSVEAASADASAGTAGGTTGGNSGITSTTGSSTIPSDASQENDSSIDGSTGGSATSSTTGSSTTGAADAGGATSGLPVPPGGGVPVPSGTPANVTVLNWAGFKAAVSWTFDDSQPSQIAHYAELQAVGVPMTFYISTGNTALANYDATWTRAAQDGHELGNHTVHHCQANLTGCSFGSADATLADELDQCTSYITQHYPQTAVYSAASPFGDTGYDAPASSRFLVNRGVGSGLIGAGLGDATDPYNLPCHLAASGETMSSFNAATDSARSAGKWLIFLIHTISPTNDNWYNPVAVGDVTGGMSYGKSAGDVWLDTVANIAAYWRAQKVFAAAAPTTSGGSTTWTWTLPAHFPPGKYLRVKVDGGTLTQGGTPLVWNDHGYYEIALDAGSLTLSP